MSFAKRTGDYGFLSKTDLKVLALARMFEVEANGTKNLRNMPQKVYFVVLFVVLLIGNC